MNDAEDRGEGEGEDETTNAELERRYRRPRSLWSRSVTIPQGGVGVVVVDVKCDDPEGPPHCYAIATSLGLNGSANPTYDITIGIGEDSFRWLGLPGLAPNAVRIVMAHAVRVAAHGSLFGQSILFAAAVPTDAAPTLTP